MFITIKRLGHSKYEMELDDVLEVTVAKVKAVISTHWTDLEIEQQKLVYKGKVLADDRTLKDYGVQESALLVLSRKRKKQPSKSRKLKTEENAKSPTQNVASLHVIKNPLKSKGKDRAFESNFQNLDPSSDEEESLSLLEPPFPDIESLDEHITLEFQVEGVTDKNVQEVGNAVARELSGKCIGAVVGDLRSSVLRSVYAVEIDIAVADAGIAAKKVQKSDFMETPWWRHIRGATVWRHLGVRIVKQGKKSDPKIGDAERLLHAAKNISGYPITEHGIGGHQFQKVQLQDYLVNKDADLDHGRDMFEEKSHMVQTLHKEISELEKDFDEEKIRLRKYVNSHPDNGKPRASWRKGTVIEIEVTDFSMISGVYSCRCIAVVEEVWGSKGEWLEVSYRHPNGGAQCRKRVKRSSKQLHSLSEQYQDPNTADGKKFAQSPEKIIDWFDSEYDFADSVDYKKTSSSLDFDGVTESNEKIMQAKLDVALRQAQEVRKIAENMKAEVGIEAIPVVDLKVERAAEVHAKRKRAMDKRREDRKLKLSTDLKISPAERGSTRANWRRGSVLEILVERHWRERAGKAAWWCKAEVLGVSTNPEGDDWLEISYNQNGWKRRKRIKRNSDFLRPLEKSEELRDPFRALELRPLEIKGFRDPFRAREVRLQSGLQIKERQSTAKNVDSALRRERDAVRQRRDIRQSRVSSPRSADRALHRQSRHGHVQPRPQLLTTDQSLRDEPQSAVDIGRMFDWIDKFRFPTLEADKDSSAAHSQLTSQSSHSTIPGLREGLQSVGWNLVSPVFDVCYPEIPGVPDFYQLSRIRSLIWSFAGSDFNVVFSYPSAIQLSASQLVQSNFNAPRNVRLLIEDYLGAGKDCQLFAIHVSDDINTAIDIRPVRIDHDLNTCSITISHFSRILFVECNITTIAMHYTERRDLEVLLCNASFFRDANGSSVLGSKESILKQKDYFTDLQQCDDYDEFGERHFTEKSLIKKHLAALSFVEKCFSSKINYISQETNPIPLIISEVNPNSDYNYIYDLEFYGSSKELIAKRGPFGLKAGPDVSPFAALSNNTPTQVASFRMLISNEPQRSWFRFFGRDDQQELSFGPYDIRNEFLIGTATVGRTQPHTYDVMLAEETGGELLSTTEDLYLPTESTGETQRTIYELEKEIQDLRKLANASHRPSRGDPARPLRPLHGSPFGRQSQKLSGPDLRAETSESPDTPSAMSSSPSYLRVVPNPNEELFPVKCAAVFPVFRNRIAQKSLDEAWNFERKLRSTGYGNWLCGNRKSPEDPPISVSKHDIEAFNDWLIERKENNDIDGIFIMVIAHGYTANDGKPKLMLQDCNDFDVESWVVNNLAGSDFPIICVISSCRINTFAKLALLKATTLDVPNNVFLSWGAARGELATEGDFVTSWRVFIADSFKEKSIVEVAESVRYLSTIATHLIKQARVPLAVEHKLERLRGKNCTFGILPGTVYVSLRADISKHKGKVVKSRA